MHYFIFSVTSDEYNEPQGGELILQGQASGK